MVIPMGLSPAASCLLYDEMEEGHPFLLF